MSKHKSTDYKLTAVKYYLKGKSSLDEVCHIFNCSPKSLYRWVKRYKMIKHYKDKIENLSLIKSLNNNLNMLLVC